MTPLKRVLSALLLCGLPSCATIDVTPHIRWKCTTFPSAQINSTQMNSVMANGISSVSIDSLFNAVYLTVSCKQEIHND